MTDRGPDEVPSTSTLIAFESAARLGNFSRAARELGTSQSAISRHIASLERQLSTRLFDRSRTGVSLTAAGHLYRKAVLVGLGALQAAAAELAALSDEEPAEVVIECSEEVSHLFVAPGLDALRKTLGAGIRVRILVRSHGNASVPAEAEADLILAWDEGFAAPEECTVIATGAVGALCSPGYATLHAEVLAGPVAGWGGLTFLCTTGPVEHRMPWDTWFAAAGRPASGPCYKAYESYMHALDAALSGHGVLLGWRHLVGRQLESGLLVALSGGFVETGRRFHAALTARGRNRPLARRCLALFAEAA